MKFKNNIMTHHVYIKKMCKNWKLHEKGVISVFGTFEFWKFVLKYILCFSSS